MKRYGLVVPMLLASCGTLPEPFYGDPGLTGAKLAAPPAPILVVPTPGGAMLGDTAAAAYARDLASALNALDVPSIARPATRGDWLLATTATSSAGSVFPAYAIAGPDGKIYGTQTGAAEPVSSWAAGDPAALQAAATADALTLSKKLADINAQVQQSNPNSLENRPPRIFMGGVTGAPGDGDNALAMNMTRDLPGPQNQLVNSPATADFTVTGIVKAQPDTNHQILVELDWIVTDSEKRKIGQVTQLHDLAPSDITPVWGDVAAAAAAEAASGVSEVISNATLHKPGQDIAVASGPLAGGYALAIPPTFALPPPGLSGAQLAAAFAPPTPATAPQAPVEVASITEPLPVAAPPTPTAPAAPAAPTAPVPATHAAARAAAPTLPSAPAATEATPERLAAAPRPAAAPPAAPVRFAANIAGAFARLAQFFAQPAATDVQEAVQPTEDFAGAVPPAWIAPAARAAVSPARAAETASLQPPVPAPAPAPPTVLITPVATTALPQAPGTPVLVAEYGATALITPVFAVKLPPPFVPAPPHARAAAGIAARGRFVRPLPPARDASAPITAQPADTAPVLPQLIAISDSQLWRVAEPIPVTFTPQAAMFRHLVYAIPATARVTARPIIHAVFHPHIAPAAAKPVIHLAAQPVPVLPPPVLPPPVVAAVTAPAAPAAPIESKYDVLER